MENNTEHTKYTRLMLFVLAIVLLIASIIGYFVSQKINKSGGPNSATALIPSPYPLVPTPSLIPYPVQGSLSVKLANSQAIKVGTPFTLEVVATSSKDTVAGYDVVLKYDIDAFDSQTIQNKQPNFRIFTYNRQSHVSVSATKNLSVSEEVRFVETSLLSFTFVPKKKGTYNFSLKPIGNESAKFVNETAVVTYPESGDIRLEIK